MSSNFKFGPPGPWPPQQTNTTQNPPQITPHQHSSRGRGGSGRSRGFRGGGHLNINQDRHAVFKQQTGPGSTTPFQNQHSYPATQFPVGMQSQQLLTGNPAYPLQPHNQHVPRVDYNQSFTSSVPHQQQNHVHHFPGGLQTQQPVTGNLHATDTQNPYTPMLQHGGIPNQGAQPVNNSYQHNYSPYLHTSYKATPQPASTPFVTQQSSFAPTVPHLNPQVGGVLSSMNAPMYTRPGISAVAPPLITNDPSQLKRKPNNISSGGLTSQQKPKKVKSEAPPSVPKFGAPLPLDLSLPPKPDTKKQPQLKSIKQGGSLAKPNTSDSKPEEIKYKKTRRGRRGKRNTLGLTPSGEDFESSSDEEDVEEEVNEEGGPSVGNQIIRIEHKGRVYILDSAAALRKWIADRKKHFPTAARVEERKATIERQRKQRVEQKQKDQQRYREKVLEEARKKVIESQSETLAEKDPKEISTATATEQQPQQGTDREGLVQQQKPDKQREVPQKKSEKQLNSPQQKNELDQRLKKLERAKKKLKKQEEKVAKAQAAATSKEPVKSGAQEFKQENVRNGNQQVLINQPDEDDSDLSESGGVKLDSDSDDPYNVDALIDEYVKSEKTTQAAERPDLIDNVEVEDSVSESDSSTLSSSSPSSSSSVSSESRPTQAPQELSSKSHLPVRVPPPPRQVPPRQKRCPQFAATGHCKWGSRCRMSHEQSNCPPGSVPEKGKISTRRRNERRSLKRLYDKLVEKELLQADKLVLDHTTRLDLE